MKEKLLKEKLKNKSLNEILDLVLIGLVEKQKIEKLRKKLLKNNKYLNSNMYIWKIWTKFS